MSVYVCVCICVCVVEAVQRALALKVKQCSDRSNCGPAMILNIIFVLYAHFPFHHIFKPATTKYLTVHPKSADDEGDFYQNFLN